MADKACDVRKIPQYRPNYAVNRTDVDPNRLRYWYKNTLISG